MVAMGFLWSSGIFGMYRIFYKQGMKHEFNVMPHTLLGINDISVNLYKNVLVTLRRDIETDGNHITLWVTFIQGLCMAALGAGLG